MDEMAMGARQRRLMKEWPKGSASPFGYVEWHEWAEAQEAHGLTQTQCKHCKRFYFPQEMVGHACSVPNGRDGQP